MSNTAPSLESDDTAAETAALAKAVAHARADKRRVPHEDVREWLLRLADGDFTALPPQPR